MLRILTGIVTIVAAMAAGFFATMYFLDPPSQSVPKRLVAVQSTSAARCEMELGPARCPGLPTFEPAKASRTFKDDYQGSGSDKERCLKRAAEFFNACSANQAVTARFYRGSTLVEERTHK